MPIPSPTANSLLPGSQSETQTRPRGSELRPLSLPGFTDNDGLGIAEVTNDGLRIAEVTARGAISPKSATARRAISPNSILSAANSPSPPSPRSITSGSPRSTFARLKHHRSQSQNDAMLNKFRKRNATFTDTEAELETVSALDKFRWSARVVSLLKASVKQRIQQKQKQKKARRKTTCLPLIYPDNRKRLVWDFWIAVLLVVQLCYVPMRLMFLVSYEWDIVDGVMDIFFLLDMVFTFFLTYKTLYGWERDHKKIAKRYLKGWFIIDLLALFPFYLWAFGGSSFAKALRLVKEAKLLRLLRLLKMMRTTKLYHVVGRMDVRTDLLKTIYRNIFPFVMFILVAHFVTNLWLWIVTLDDEDESSFLWLASGYLSEYQSHFDAISDFYLTGSYFIYYTLTSTGYGNMLVLGDGLRMFSVVVMMCGTICVVVYTVAVEREMEMRDRRNQEYRKELSKFSTFQQRAVLPTGLNVRSKHTIEQSSKVAINNESYKNLLQCLPSAFQISTTLTLYRSLIACNPFFTMILGVDDWLLTQMLNSLTVYFYVHNDLVCQRGKRQREMFILKQGLVVPVDKTGQVVGAVHVGDTFGHLELFMRETWMYSYRTVVDSEVYAISRVRMLELLSSSKMAFTCMYGHCKREFNEQMENKIGTDQKMKLNEFIERSSMVIQKEKALRLRKKSTVFVPPQDKLRKSDKVHPTPSKLVEAADVFRRKSVVDVISNANSTNVDKNWKPEKSKEEFDDTPMGNCLRQIHEELDKLQFAQKALRTENARFLLGKTINGGGGGGGGGDSDAGDSGDGSGN